MKIKVEIEKVINIGNFNSERIHLGMETTLEEGRPYIKEMEKHHTRLNRLAENIKADILGKA